MTNAEAVCWYIAADEGGIADVGDGKGVTRFGQTAQWLRQWGLPEPRNGQEAAANTAKWLSLTGLWDIVEHDLPLGKAIATFSFHAGEDAGIRNLQRRLKVTVDGLLGPETIGALREADIREVRWGIAAEYARHLLHTMKSKKRDNRKYGGGWGNRLARMIDMLAAAE